MLHSYFFVYSISHIFSSIVKSEPNSTRASPVAGIPGSAPSSRSASPQMRSVTPSTPPPSTATPTATPTIENGPTENERGDLIEFYNKVRLFRKHYPITLFFKAPVTLNLNFKKRRVKIIQKCRTLRNWAGVRFIVVDVRYSKLLCPSSLLLFIPCM